MEERASVIRAIGDSPELREDGEDGRTMFGHFAKFDVWTEINSFFEGNFLERIAPGAFRKTFREGRDSIRALFQHGHDPTVGDKPLGPVRELYEDKEGAYYEVPLLDTSYNADILPGLREGLYGASFRFQAIREEFIEEPEASDYNPRALPERTLKEVRLFEFGPVTFPAYASATANVRSLTDHFAFEWIEQHPEEVRSLLAADLSSLTRDEPVGPDEEDAPADTDAGITPTSDGARRASRDYLRPGEPRRSWELPKKGA
jgi:HK97 family phage prohead protease